MIKKVLGILGACLGVIIIGALVFYFTVMAPGMNFAKDVETMSVQNIDVSKVSDGKYLGEFKSGKFTHQVEVTVAEHKIKDIKVLEVEDSKYSDLAKAVTNKVIEEQSLEVDAISGATTTSKALLLAIENALSKGIK